MAESATFWYVLTDMTADQAPEVHPPEWQSVASWQAISGRWDFLDDGTATYHEDVTREKNPHGIALSDNRLRNGRARTTVVFPQQTSVGRILLGFNAQTRNYFSIGVGGYGVAYLVDEYVENRGWRGLRTEGTAENLRIGVPYAIEVELRGQQVRLSVNGVRVIEHTLPYPTTGDQFGVFAWGNAPVRFERTAVQAASPKAFVVTQYGEPFDSLFSEVILPVARDVGLEAYRASDVFRPGVVLQDIIQGIVEAEVVIAEVTPVNANVFYELGFAHALGKPTILLSTRNRDRELAFDIRGFRVVFYDDTIRGKRGIEDDLRRHLTGVLEGR